MSRSFKSILLFVVILMQITVLSHFKILSVIPNYTLVFVIVISVICADTESVVYAGLSGLLMDLFTGAPLGLNTLLYIYISIGLVIISGMIYGKSIKVLCPVCFVASFLHEILFGIFSSLLRSAVFYPQSIINVVIPVALINSLIFIPVYIVLGKIRFTKKRKGIKYEC